MPTRAYIKKRLTYAWLLLLPVLIFFCTWLGFNLILNYYAPYGSSIISPMAKLIQPPKLVTAVEVWDKQNIIQPFIASSNGLGEIALQVVTWGDRYRPNDVLWTLIEVKNDGINEIKRNGKFAASKTKDWGIIKLNFLPIADSKCKRYKLYFSSSSTLLSESIGFPVWEARDNSVTKSASKVILEGANQKQEDLKGSFSGMAYYYHEKFN